MTTNPNSSRDIPQPRPATKPAPETAPVNGAGTTTSAAFGAEGPKNPDAAEPKPVSGGGDSAVENSAGRSSDIGSKKLGNYQYAILSVLHEDGGFLTGHVAREIVKTEGKFGINMHQHSGATRSWLNELYKLGLVDYLDDQKPVCWKRTPTGTALLAGKGRKS